MIKNKYDHFLIKDIFTIVATSSGIDKNKLTNINGTIPYITRSDRNNGIDMFIGKQSHNYSLNSGNVVTIGLDTQTIFYQPKKFYTGQNIQILSCSKLNMLTAMYLVPLFKKQMIKFNWGGNGATLGRLNKTKIMLPINAENQPNYEYMEYYIKGLQAQKEQEYFDYISKRFELLKDIKKPLALEEKEWKSFLIEQITEIISGKDIYEAERVIGNTPYVSSTANQNGIGYFVSNTNVTLEKGCISVNRNGSVGYSFYHPYIALFSNDCRKLRPFYESRYVGLFLSNQIAWQKEKYGYGYKMGTARLKKQKIMLPINKEQQPDYEYMEHYMKYLEYQKIKAYLDFKATK